MGHQRLRLQYGSWNTKSPFSLNEGWENELSERHQISCFHWDVSSHVEAAGSCQKKENMVLSWVTPGLHCCKMPFRSPGAGAKSGTAGKDSYLSIQPDHKQPQGRDQVSCLFCSLHPAGPAWDGLIHPVCAPCACWAETGSCGESRLS